MAAPRRSFGTTNGEHAENNAEGFVPMQLKNYRENRPFLEFGGPELLEFWAYGSQWRKLYQYSVG